MNLRAGHNARMDYFSLAKPLLYMIEPEEAHDMALRALACGMLPRQPEFKSDRLKTKLAGLQLDNPVGLAPGFDKNAETINRIFDHGFGFVECGTVTPKWQAGNPRPRLFRLKKQQAVINRLGFNNRGLEPFVERLQLRTSKGIVGANIGKNKDSEDAVADYVTCLEAVYAHADYVTINISSPNTEGLRDLQEQDALIKLVGSVYGARKKQIEAGQKKKPIFVKIAPDLNDAQKEAIADIAHKRNLDGLIVSNTTITRPDVGELPPRMQQGGLSGKPLFALSTDVLRDMYRLTKGKTPLIGVGGIASADDAYAKIKAGASAIQLYSALVYQGMGLVTKIKRGLDAKLEQDGFKSIRDAVGVEAEA